MRRTVIGVAAILVASLSMAALEERFTPVKLVAWTIFFAALFWQELFGRRWRACRLGRPGNSD